MSSYLLRSSYYLLMIAINRAAHGDFPGRGGVEGTAISIYYSRPHGDPNFERPKIVITKENAAHAMLWVAMGAR